MFLFEKPNEIENEENIIIFSGHEIDKMGYCTDSAPRNGPYNSFKSPLLQQQKPEEKAKPEENPIDPRLKNIGRAHDMFSRIFGTRIYEYFPLTFMSKRPRTDLNKRSLPRHKTTTA